MAGSSFVNSFVFQITALLVLFSESSSYEELLLEDPKICKLRESDEAVIQVAKDRAKIITQQKYLTSLSGRYNFNCSFTVRAGRSLGLYGVVQVLNFRKDENTGYCKDYVKFEEFHMINSLLEPFIKPKVKSCRKFCGRMYAGQKSSDFRQDRHCEMSESVLQYDLAPNGFTAPGGKIQVTIFVGSEQLQEDEKLDLQLVFTAYKADCSDKSDSIKCRSCERIGKEYHEDNIQNCPYKSCKDENNCKDLKPPFEGRDVVSTGTGTKFTVGAVATIILLFLIFATCLWVCRRSQRCLWSTNNNSARIELNRTGSSSRPEENVSSYGDLPPGSTTPSAPPLSEMKDLPPSYDSLFPAK